METLYTFWLVLQAAVGFHLIFPLVLASIYFFVRRFRNTQVETESQEADYAIIVTAYEQTDLLPAVVESLTKLNYQNYLIYIVADKCDTRGLHFGSDKVVLLRPEETLGSNTRSHFYAIKHFKRDHLRLTIIDSDNLVDPEYLNELNKYFDQGYEAVQGVREAKNLNTVFACLDAARDKYYHYYDGKMLYGSGSSATLAGSGMAFTTDLYKECLQDLDIVGAGFDKVLQFRILSLGRRIAFCSTAIVYDEKTSKPEMLVKQRARWINTWFKYFAYGFSLAGKGLTGFNWNQFLFGLVLLRPPLFMFLLLGLIFLSVNLLLDPFMAMVWASGFLVFVTGFFVALRSSETDSRIYKSLAGIPRFIMLQVISLTKAKKANKISVATRHEANV